ncbi:hypothetical protein [Amycolatopsis sp. NPDC059657]|uniref:hypothetical protein n=1 Tax=Amycolatopsis sp. NPDC059657 TaxID=3346899 RepID=UPI00366EFE3E
MSAEPPDLPRYRVMLALDIEGSTARTNPAKAELRRVMYELLEEALRAGGISEAHRDALVDRGDGVLVLIRPVDEVPKTALLNPVIPTLTKLLAAHDALHPDHRFRLRAVVHAGEVHYDGHGNFGEALDVAFRLLDAPAVKAALEQTDAPVALVVSDDIYRCVVKHGYEGIDVVRFDPLVTLQLAGIQHRGWVHIPDEDAAARQCNEYASKVSFR